MSLRSEPDPSQCVQQVSGESTLTQTPQLYSTPLLPIILIFQLSCQYCLFYFDGKWLETETQTYLKLKFGIKQKVKLVCEEDALLLSVITKKTKQLLCITQHFRSLFLAVLYCIAVTANNWKSFSIGS